MRYHRAFLLGSLAVSCASLAACDLVAGIGTYCEVGVDPGCATSGTGATGGSGGTGGTGATGGTGGTAAECTPGEQRECYSGPRATKGIGTCKAGTEQCNPEGTGFEPCAGEVIPGPEKPDEIGDEACDGYGPGEPIWWRTFGNDSEQWPDDIAADKDGNVYVCGTFEGTLQFDETPALVSQGGNDIFLVKLDKDGKAVWSRRFGDGNDQADCHMAADSQGVAIAGTWHGTMYFGGQVLGGAFEKAYVARYNGSGNHLWSAPLQLFTGPNLRSIATLPSGDVVLVGWIPNSNQDGGSDAFALQLAANDGILAWSKLISDEVYTDQAGNQTALDVATNDDGEIAIVGQFEVPQYAKGLTNYRYDGSGNLLDHKEYQVGGLGGACDVEDDFRIAFGPEAEHILSGSFWCTLYLDSFTFEGPTDQLNTTGDVFWTKVNPDWTVPWAHHYPAPSELLSPLRLAIDAGGNVVVAAETENSVNFGGGVAGPDTGGGGVVFAKVAPSGAHSWTRSFPGGAQSNPQIATLTGGSAAFALSFSSTIVVGMKPSPAVGARDILIGKLAP